MIKVSALSTQNKDDQGAKNSQEQVNSRSARIQQLKDKTLEKSKADLPKFHVSKQGNLKSLKILSAPEEEKESAQDYQPPNKADTTYEKNLAPVFIERENITRVNIIGSILTGAWFGACAYFLFKTHFVNAVSLSTVEVGAYLSFILAPPALLWLALSNLQRRSDIEYYTALLRSELHNILFPQGEHPDKISRDIERLCQQASQLSASSQKVMKSIQTARLGLRDEIKEFEALSQKTERHIDTLSDNLSTKTEKLLKLSAEIDVRFKKIQENSEKSLLDTQKISDRLVDVSRGTEDKNNQALSRLENVEHNLTSQTSSLSVVTEEIENSASRLEDTFTVQLGHIEDVSSRIFEELHASEEKLDAQQSVSAQICERLEKQNDRLDQRQEVLSNILETRMESLGQIGDKVLGRVEGTAKQLRDQIQNISTLSGQVSAQTTKLNKDIEQQNHILETSLQTTINNMSDISAALEETINNAENHADKSENIINNINNNIKVNSEELRELSDGSINTLRSFGNQINEELARFDEICESLEKKAQKTSESIQETMLGIQPNCQEIFSKIEGVETRFEGLKDTITTLSDKNVERLEKLGQEFDLQLLNINKVTAEAITEIDHVGDGLAVSSEKIKEITSENIKYLNNARQDIEREIINFGLVGDDISVKLGDVQKAIDEKNNELSEIIAQSVVQIKDAAFELGDTARMTAEVSEEVVALITESLTHTEIQTESFHKAAQNHLRQTNTYSADISAKTEDILQRTKESLKELDKTRLSINSRHKDMETQFESVLRMAGYYSEEMSKNAKLVAQNAQDTTHSISKAGRDLKKEIGSLNVVADDVTLKIKAVQKDLGQESRDLIRVSTEVLKTNEKTSQNFAKYSHQLAKFGQDIKSSTLDLRKMMNEKEEEHFLSSARYLLESIYALTVDLTRSVDGRISEKMWKEFNSGKNDVFLKHLQKVEKYVPVAKLREKFKTDPEFRSYAKRYIAQFEKMYQQLQSIENNELLKMTIMASDTAKLYEILIKSSGQNDVIKVA